jgi:hypothetical protein
MNIQIDWFEILIQGIGFVGIVAAIIAFQAKKHRNIILFRNANTLLFALQYLLLNAYSGAAMNMLSFVRNEIYSWCIKKNKKTIYAQMVFCGIYIASGILTWAGIESLIIIISKFFSTYAYGIKDTKWLRIFTLISVSCMLVYNIYARSWAGVICEVFTMISLIIALVRFYVLPKHQKQNE